MGPPAWNEVAVAYLDAESHAGRCLQLGLGQLWAVEATHLARVEGRGADLQAWVGLLLRVESASAEHRKLFVLQECPP